MQIRVCLKVQLVIGQAFLGADEIAHCVDSAQSKEMMDYCELLAELDVNFAVVS